MSDKDIKIAKQYFNTFFQDHLYGKYDNDDNIILSRGTRNDEVIVYPDFFAFCTNYTLLNKRCGYSDSLGHKNVFRAIKALVNIPHTELYTDEHIALTLGNVATFQYVGKLLASYFNKKQKLLTLSPYYPPILNALEEYFSIDTIDSIEVAEDMLLDLIHTSIKKDASYKVLLIPNAIGVNSRVFSASFFKTLIQLIELYGVYLIIDEGLQFTPLQYTSTIQHEQVIRLVSASKLLGVAGMKLGFMLASQTFIAQYYNIASNNYGGPLSFFFLLQEFLYFFEAWRISGRKDIDAECLLLHEYTIEYDTLSHLYTNYLATMQENHDTFEKHLSYVRQRYTSNKDIFPHVCDYGGINILIGLPKGVTSYPFFLELIQKYTTSVLPGKCIGIADDTYFRVNFLEPWDTLTTGLDSIATCLRTYQDTSTSPLQLKCLCFDIDGTLTTKDGEISPDTYDMFKQIHAHGIKIALVTGRGSYYVQHTYPELYQATDYLLTCDGNIQEAGTHVFYKKEFSSLEIKRRCYANKQIRDNIFLNTYDGIYPLQGSLDESSSLKPFEKRFDDDRTGIVQLYLKNISAKQKTLILRSIHGIFDYYFFQYRDTKNFSGILLPKDSSKKNNILRFLKHTDMMPYECLYFGDEINDAHIHETDINVICPSHAVAAVQKHAHHIIGDNESLFSYITTLFGWPTETSSNKI